MFWGIARPVVQDPGRRLELPRRRVGPDDRPPEQQRRDEEQGVLEAVRPRVLEGEVEQRREVAGPHDRREHDPRHHRERQPADDRGVEHGQDPAAAHVGRRGLEEQRDRPGEQQEGRRRPASAAGAGPCASRTAWCRRRRARSPRRTGPRPRRPPSRPSGGGRSGGADAPGSPAGPPPPQQQREHRRQPGQRVERPAEQQARGVGRHRDRRAVGQDGRGEGEHRDDRRRRAAASARPAADGVAGRARRGPGDGAHGSILAPRDDVVPRAGRASGRARPRTWDRAAMARGAAPVGYDLRRPGPPHGRRSSADGETSLLARPQRAGGSTFRGTRCRCPPGRGPGPARSSPAC